MLKASYHTHCYRCGHAKGTEREYIEAAIRAGYEVIGMSDHAPLFVNKKTKRMQPEELDIYVDTLRNLREEYKDKIKVFIGLEAEYLEEEMPYYKKILDEGKIEYLVFGNHYYKTVSTKTYMALNRTKKGLEQYETTIIKGMETGLFSFVAHPDLYMMLRWFWSKDCEDLAHKICRKAIELDLPLEYNAQGYRALKGYPHKRFWEIAKFYNNKVLIGTDAHSPMALEDEFIKKAIDRAEKLELNIIDFIDIKVKNN